MKKIVFLGLSLLLLSACSNNTKKKQMLIVHLQTSHQALKNHQVTQKKKVKVLRQQHPVL